MVFRPSPGRWPLAVRVAVSTAVTAAVGWAAGDIGAGLIATLGVFTADYGTDRPYANRGIQSAVIAVALAAAVTVGAWASAVAWLAVAAVSVVAVLAVWLCAALGVGPPGGYMFVVVCAAGIGVSASHLQPWQIGLLVLGGGATAWLAQMSAAIADPRGPEKKAVKAAGTAVAAYLQATCTPAAALARQRAAESLSRAWEILVDHQPAFARSAAGLYRLRDANHALHSMFADAMAAAGRGRPAPAPDAELARAIGALEADPAAVIGPDRSRPPLPPVAVPVKLAESLSRGSHNRRVMVRVAVATPLAGALAAGFGVGHAYWAMAAAVLVLHQGAHLMATLQRGTERVVGTLVGLGFAALILIQHPQGWWLIAAVAGLQFCIEMYIVANYALATMFITAIALTISSGTHRVDIGALILDRGLDTVLGCAVGVLVYLTLARRQEASRLHGAIAEVLARTAGATEFLARNSPRSIPARSARRALQDSIFALNAADDAARHGSRSDRAAATRLAAVTAATEHLGYATVAGCWAAEQCGSGIFGDADPEAYLAVLRRLAESIERVEPVATDSELPPFAASEARDLLAAVHGLR
ncbi:MAG: FUSC family protein [Mycobacterium sp.]|nr:FUSC family protein [Mycobacterium sp.]